ALRRIERDAVMQPVDPQISDVADPVADLCAQRPPEGVIAGVIGAAQANAVELDDTGVARREIAPAAPDRTHHEIDAVVRGVRGEQRGLHVTAPAFAFARVLHRKAELAQPSAYFRQRRLVPELDADARAFAEVLAEAHRAEAVVRAEGDLAVLVGH